MPVVINEFEAVAESPRAPGAGSGGDAGPQPPGRIEPQALRQPLRRLALRHERLKAH